MAKVELKKPVVEEISAQIAGAESVILVNYSGLTVEQDTKLRKELREAGVHYKVYKNTMMNFAFQGTPCEELCKDLEGTNALAISKDDATARPESSRNLLRLLRSWKWFPVLWKAATMTRKAWRHWQLFRQGKNFLANCLEASSHRSLTWLVFLIRSQSPKAAKQQRLN